MKKIITSIYLLALTTDLFAATTGALLLQANNPRRISIGVTPISVASALDLTTTQSNLKVATIVEKSNSKTGYKVTIKSANLGKLKREDGAEVFNYTMKLDGSTVALNTAAGTVFTRSQSTPITVSRNLTISYTGKAVETMIEGTYSDTVTLDIAAR